jgi:Tfp pilus assembly protein PilF
MKYFLLLFVIVCSCSQGETTNNKLTYNELIDKGIAFEKNLDYSSAKECFQSAWLKDSNRVEANYWLASVYAFYFQDSSAIRYLNKAISIDKTYRKGLIKRSYLRLRRQDPNGALQDLNEAVAIKNNLNDTELYLNRALVKHALNDNDGACEDLLKAQQLGSYVAKINYSSKCGVK